MTTVDHAGFLVKQGKIVKNWKLRWFELSSDNVLRYYRSARTNPNEPPKELAGEIDLTTCSWIFTGDEIGGNVMWPRELLVGINALPAMIVHCVIIGADLELPIPITSTTSSEPKCRFALKLPSRTYYFVGLHLDETVDWLDQCRSHASQMMHSRAEPHGGDAIGAVLEKELPVKPAKTADSYDRLGELFGEQQDSTLEVEGLSIQRGSVVALAQRRTTHKP